MSYLSVSENTFQGLSVIRVNRNRNIDWCNSGSDQKHREKGCHITATVSSLSCLHHSPTDMLIFSDCPSLTSLILLLLLFQDVAPTSNGEGLDFL